MSTFHPSTSLRQPVPTATQKVLSTTSPLLSSSSSNATNNANNNHNNQNLIESHPQLGKWYMRNYGLGPRKDVKFLTRNAAPSNRYTSITFRVGMNQTTTSTAAAATTAHNSVVNDLHFGSKSALLVASGPRVELYRSNLTKALKAESMTQKKQFQLFQNNEMEEEQEEDEEYTSQDQSSKEKNMKKKKKNLGGLFFDDIEPDRNISTGGLLSSCATFRSDSKLIAIGSEGGVLRIVDANSRATLRTFYSSHSMKEDGSVNGGGGGGGGGSSSSSIGDRKTIRSVAWLRDGKRIVAGGDDGLVRIWNLSSSSSSSSNSNSNNTTISTGGEDSGNKITLRGHGDKITSVKVVSFRTDDLLQSNKSNGVKRSSRTSVPNYDDRQLLKDDTPYSDDSSTLWTQYVVSASYDHTLRVWDIQSNTQARGQDRCISIMNHGDPIQALLVLPSSDDDHHHHHSRGYNRSGGEEQTTSYHSHPRKRSHSSSKLWNNIPLVVSAGGTTLKIWNILNGTCLGTYMTQHAKTITALCLLDIPQDESEEPSEMVVESETNTSSPLLLRRKRHIITAGLDGLVRIYSASMNDILSSGNNNNNNNNNTSFLPFVHGMQITEPISALTVSSDMSRIAIGTTSGIVMVHQRRRIIANASTTTTTTTTTTTPAVHSNEPRHGTYTYFTRGANEKSYDPEDYMLLHKKKQKLAEYDVLLRKFRYGDALDAVLAKRQPQAVMAVLEELGKRCGLVIALSNRDEESLDAILSFTTRFIDNPQYTSHLIGVAHILCDIYGSLLGQSAVVDELFVKLRAKVTMECAVQKMLLRLVGQIEYVMNTAEILAEEEGERKTSKEK